MLLVFNYVILSIPFCPIMRFAQHLAILNRSLSTFAPSSNMVALHEFEVKLLATDGANVILFFPNGKFDVFWESTQVKITLIASQHEWNDA